MGVITKLAEDVTESIAGPAARESVEKFGDKWLSLASGGESSALDTDAGKAAVGMLRSYKADVKKDAYSLSLPYIQQIPKNASAPIKKMLAQSNAKEMQVGLRQSAAMNDNYHFGTNRSKLSQAISLAAQQRNSIHATNIADMISTSLQEETPKTFYKAGKPTDWRREAGIKTKSPYTAPTEAERDFRSGLSWLFLGRVGVPHVMQQFNVAMTEGVRPWAKAWAERYADPVATAQFAHNSGAMFDETLRSMQDIAAGRDTIWHKYLHMPLLSKERQWYIVHAAEASKWSAIDAAQTYARTKNDASRLQLEFFGLEPSKVLSQGGRLSQDDMLRAGYQGADENMHIDRGIKTPPSWDESKWSRSLFLYKHFQFREGKLIKDTIVRGLRGGPLSAAQTLGTITVMWPVAGHIIGDMENVVTGRSPEDRSHIFRPVEKAYGTGPIPKFADERIDDLGHVAAFGIWYSLFRAVALNRTDDYLAGPTISFVSDILRLIYGAGTGNIKPFAKGVIRKVPVVGPAIAAHTLNN